jgi:hypothetical protein
MRGSDLKLPKSSILYNDYIMKYLFIIWCLFSPPIFGMTHFGTWSEWSSFNNLPQKFDYLKKSKARLHLAIKKDELTDSNFKDLISFLKKAESEKIQYWLWPLLSKSDGYWPNQWNMSIYSQYVRELVERLEKQNLHPQGISIDLEPPPEKLEKYLKLLQEFKIKELHQFSSDGIDENLFKNASFELSSLYQFLKNKKMVTHIVTTPFLLEPKYTLRLQKVFGIPIIKDSFDYISFMAYRSEFERLIGEMNSRLVYDYSLKAKEMYGEKAGIDLGVVGNIEFPHKLTGYSDPSRLWEDIAAAKAAGITKIQVYCLEGIHSEEWLKDVEPKVPFWSLKFFFTNSFLTFLFSQI